MASSLLMIFLLSAVSLFLANPLKRIFGILLSLITTGILVYFLFFFGDIREGSDITSSFNWFPSLNIRFSLFLDGLSLLFGILVLGIGALILLYSQAYMAHHEYKGRFYSYMMLFMGSMLGVVLAGNLITLYLFWSLTSFSSFLLIGFYSRQGPARKAALQALIITEAGGLAMLAGFLLMGIVAGTYEISQIISGEVSLISHQWYKLILLLVLAGAFTKSAQFPFHFWLPEAMKAPTPVSAYLHSASMVNAGIYLLARLMPVLSPSILWNQILIITGLVTLFIGVYLSLTARDIKRILAYTTISSLGMMVFLLGIDTPLALKAALLYLVVHALYKSSLFMVAGIVDEKTGTRDIYETPKLWRKMKTTSVIAIIALLSMAGMPPLLGFIGKEFIYEAALHSRIGGISILTVTILSNAMMFMISAILAWELFFRDSAGGKGKQEAAGFVFVTGAAILSLTGLLLAIMPGRFEPLLEYSVKAVENSQIEVDLKLWKGISKVFYLSLGTLLTGLIMTLFRRPLLRFFNKINKWIFSVSLADLFNRTVKAAGKYSSALTVFVQHGYQRLYLLVIFSFIAALLWYLVFTSGINVFQSSYVKISPTIAGIAILSCLAAITATFTNSKLSAIVTIGVVGYGITIIYFFYSAIDLAMTQLLVETLTLVIFVIVVYRLPKFEKFSPVKSRIRDGIIAIFTGGSITAIVLLTGIINTDKILNVSEELAGMSYTEAHGRNIVNVILVDFRAFDTMGEITVVLLAALGIYSILSYKIKKKKR